MSILFCFTVCFGLHVGHLTTEVTFGLYVTEDALTNCINFLALLANIFSITLHSLFAYPATDMSLDSRRMGMFSHSMHML